MLSALIRKWLPRRAPAPRRTRLGLEALEAREVPATVTWINPAGGNWNVAANWDTGAVPGIDDDAVIDVPGLVPITFNHAVMRPPPPVRARS